MVLFRYYLEPAYAIFEFLHIVEGSNSTIYGYSLHLLGVKVLLWQYLLGHTYKKVTKFCPSTVKSSAKR